MRLGLVARGQIDQCQAISTVVLDVELQLVAPVRSALEATGPNAHAHCVRDDGRGAVDGAERDQDVDQDVQH